MTDSAVVMHRSALAALIPALLASCVAPPVDRPAPRPAPVTVAPPPPALVPQPVPIGAVEAGDWRYARTVGGSSAQFGSGALAFECRPGQGDILVRTPDASGPMTLRASTTARTIAAQDGVVRLSASDPILDALAFSRGKFGVGSRWYPAWPELTRVIEDCRG
jgi:hypothetical protein